MRNDRELPAEARRHILVVNALFPVGVLTVAWALYASVALFDFDLIAQLKPRSRATREFDAEKLYLWIAIIATVLCLGLAWFNIRRALHLANHGIPIVCEVIKVGKISAQGMVRVDYKYLVDGRIYRRSLSCLRETARNYQSGVEPLEIVYDPQNPKRVMLKSDVFAKSKAAVDDDERYDA